MIKLPFRRLPRCVALVFSICLTGCDSNDKEEISVSSNAGCNLEIIGGGDSGQQNHRLVSRATQRNPGLRETPRAVPCAPPRRGSVRDSVAQESSPLLPLPAPDDPCHNDASG